MVEPRDVLVLDHDEPAVGAFDYLCVTSSASRCFALLPTSRRGAMGLCGERLGSVGVGVAECGWVGRVGWGCFLGPV